MSSDQSNPAEPRAELDVTDPESFAAWAAAVEPLMQEFVDALKRLE